MPRPLCFLQIQVGEVTALGMLGPQVWDSLVTMVRVQINYDSFLWNTRKRHKIRRRNFHFRRDFDSRFRESRSRVREFSVSLDCPLSQPGLTHGANPRKNFCQRCSLAIDPFHIISYHFIAFHIISYHFIIPSVGASASGPLITADSLGL